MQRDNRLIDAERDAIRDQAVVVDDADAEMFDEPPNDVLPPPPPPDFELLFLRTSCLSKMSNQSMLHRLTLRSLMSPL